MLKRFLACLLVLCLLCPAALAEGSDPNASLTEFLELYALYQTALESGMDLPFEEFCSYYLTYLSQANGAQGAAPTVMEEPAPTVTEEPAPAVIEFTDSSTYLPDPHYFFNERLKHTEKVIGGGAYIRFDFHPDAAEAVSEYIALLSEDSRFNLELRETDTRSGVAFVETLYAFDYTGNAVVDEIAAEIGLYEDSVVHVAPLIITIDDWRKNTYPHSPYYIKIYYSFDFSFVETDDRSSIKAFIDNCNDGVLGPIGSYVEDIGGNSGKVAPTAAPNVVVPVVPDGLVDTRRQCSTCNGTGWRTCMTCGGKGTIDKLVTSVTGGSQWVHEDCPSFSCVAGSVKCTMCGGDGWL